MPTPTTELALDELRITAGPPPTIHRALSPLTGRWLLPLSCALWVGVVTIAMVGWDKDDWQVWYAAYTFCLMAAAAVTAATTLSVVRNDLRTPLASVGVAVTAIAVATTVVAWALPFWMGSMAIGYAVLAAGVPRHRRGTAALAVAQLAGVLTIVVGEAVGIGTPDAWGDHPLAQMIGLVTAAAMTVGALVVLVGDAGRSWCRARSVGVGHRGGV